MAAALARPRPAPHLARRPAASAAGLIPPQIPLNPQGVTMKVAALWPASETDKARDNGEALDSGLQP